MIKVVFVSDIHYLSEYSKRILKLIRNLKKVKPDLVILGGDISDSIGGFEKVLKHFKLSFPDIEVGVLAGNHDLWCCNWAHPDYMGDYEKDFSDTIFYKLIPEICNKVGVTYLEGTSIIVHNWAFTGTIGWYDYSAKYPYLPYNNEYYSYNVSDYTKDGYHVKLSKSDIQFSEECKAKLEKEIDILNSREDIEYIGVFTHVPPFKESIYYKPGSGKQALEWNLGCAYFYNVTLGEYLRHLNKVRAVVSGHTHRHFQDTIRGGIFTDKENIITGGDYGCPKFYEIDFFMHDGSTLLEDFGIWKTTIT